MGSLRFGCQATGVVFQFSLRLPSSDILESWTPTEKGDRMRRRLLIVGLLIGLAAMLTGCEVSQDDGTTNPGVVGTIFYSSGGNYDPVTKTFKATWNGGDFSNTYFEAKLNYTEEYIESFYAKQTRSGLWGAWTYVHEIRGNNILYSYTDGNSRYFIVDGSDAHVIISEISYKAWSTSLGSAQNPVEWVSSPGALTGDTSDIITIRLDS